MTDRTLEDLRIAFNDAFAVNPYKGFDSIHVKEFEESLSDSEARMFYRAMFLDAIENL